MVGYVLLCAGVFLAAYVLNTTYISVFYHRGLTHGALELRPWFKTFVAQTGNWVTGLDPRAWIAMHRMHHAHSDTPLDPHSPSHYGRIGVMLAQLRSYEKALRAIKKGEEPYTSLTKDLGFPVNWLNRRKLWYLPYVLHLGVALALGLIGDAWALGACYWVGMMSHPVQGWMVNAFGHSSGYRNYETNDDSRNNTFVAWFVAGEGYQNNHHQTPSAPKLSHKWYELDTGYAFCVIGQALGLFRIKHPTGPAPATRVPSPTSEVLETIGSSSSSSV